MKGEQWSRHVSQSENRNQNNKRKTLTDWLLSSRKPNNVLRIFYPRSGAQKLGVPWTLSSRLSTWPVHMDIVLWAYVCPEDKVENTLCTRRIEISLENEPLLRTLPILVLTTDAVDLCNMLMRSNDKFVTPCIVFNADCNVVQFLVQELLVQLTLWYRVKLHVQTCLSGTITLKVENHSSHTQQREKRVERDV